MKLTKSKLKEIIRETIEEEMNIPIWEKQLPEGWFQDLKAKAQQAYIKANPGSKYAKGVKSGEKEAPMTGKEKDAAAAEKRDQEARERHKENQAIAKSNQEHFYKQLKPNVRGIMSADKAEESETRKKIQAKVSKNLPGTKIYFQRIKNELMQGRMSNSRTYALQNFLDKPNKKTQKAMDDEFGYGRPPGSKSALDAMEFGKSAAAEKTAADKKKEKRSSSSSSSGKKDDFGKTLSKAMTTGAMASDNALKENIELIGKSDSGVNIYEFDYKNKSYGNGRYRGVIAQEVPHASVKGDDGYMWVDYSKIDVKFEKIN